MNCTRARFLLYAYLDRDLPACGGRGPPAPPGLLRPLRRPGPLGPGPGRAPAHPARLRPGAHRPAGAASQRPADAPDRACAMRPSGSRRRSSCSSFRSSPTRRGPTAAAMSLPAPVALGGLAARVVPVSRQMTGTFVCLQCEAQPREASLPARRARPRARLLRRQRRDLARHDDGLRRSRQRLGRPDRHGRGRRVPGVRIPARRRVGY